MTRNSFYWLFFWISFAAWAKPAWIDQPDQSCRAGELCAVGMAEGRIAAELKAREALALIFESRIVSETRVNQSLDSADQLLGGQWREEIASEIRQSTDMVLRGSTIRETYEDSDSAYALASLNKRQAADSLAELIRELDLVNKTVFEKPTRSDVIRLLKNFEVRDHLAQLRRVVAMDELSSPVSREQVHQLRRRFREQAPVILIQTGKNDFERRFQHEVIRELLAYDYKVVTEEARRFDYRVEVEVIFHERHLKVKGFLKREVEARVSSYQGAERIGLIHLTEVASGRSLEQIYERLLPPLAKNLTRQIDELKLN